MDIEAIKAALKAAQERLEAEAKRIGGLADDASDEEVKSAEDAFAEAEKEVESRSKDLKRAETRARAIEVAKQASVIADVKVTKNESAYRRDRGGYLKDLLNAGTGDSEARSRLEANNAEYRDLTGAATSAGEFVPPVYLRDQWVELARAERALANVVKKLPLTDEGSSLSMPAITSGTTTAVRTAGGSVSDTDAVTANVKAEVVEIAGQQDIDRYAIERSAPQAEVAILDDLFRSYAATLEGALINGAGNGSNRDHVGLLSVSGTNALTYTSAAPTVPELFVKILEGIAKVASDGKSRANVVVMNPRRWYWMLAGLDANYRQFITSHGPSNNYGSNGEPVSSGYVGDIQGVPVLISHGVPTTLAGSPGTQDAVIIANKDDLVLYEVGDGLPKSVRFDSVGSATGAIRVGVYGFTAFFGNRRPKAISKITGTGLVTLGLLERLKEYGRRLRALEMVDRRQADDIRTGDPVGQLIWRALPGVPQGWLLANGQPVTSDYPVLRQALVSAGNPYGTGGGNPLAPNYIGRFPRGNTSPGGTGGADSVALSASEMPSHTHSAGTLAAASNGAHAHTFDWHVAADAASGTANGMYSPNNHAPNQNRSTSNTGAHGHTITGSTGSAGSGAAHENRPPFVDAVPLIRAY